MTTLPGNQITSPDSNTKVIKANSIPGDEPKMVTTPDGVDTPDQYRQTMTPQSGENADQPGHIAEGNSSKGGQKSAAPSPSQHSVASDDTNEAERLTPEKVKEEFFRGA